jgi:hypothetical protein
MPNDIGRLKRVWMAGLSLVIEFKSRDQVPTTTNEELCLRKHRGTKIRLDVSRIKPAEEFYEFC